MTFYTESYFMHQQQFNSLINYAVILILILLVLINSFRYFRHLGSNLPDNPFYRTGQ